MIRSKTLVDQNGYRVNKTRQIKSCNIAEHDDVVVDEWWVLKKDIEGGVRISIPFDEVKASGSHINLEYEGSRAGTINGALTGTNTYKDQPEVPKEVVETLQEIGPW